MTATREDSPNSLKNRIKLSPSVPCTLTFNGRRATFTTLYLYYPAPLRVEGVQADAVVQGVDGDNITVFIPLMVGGQASGFLDAISSRLGPTPDGLSDVDKESGKFKTIPIPTGQDWSLTNLVSATDPYFTWVDAELEQYTMFDTAFMKRIGWRSKTGPQVIYFQNPSPIAASELSALTSAVSPVTPSDVLSSITGPLYAAGEVSCPSPPIKLKAPKFKLSALSDATLYIFIVFAAFLGIVVATALIQDPNGMIAKLGNAIAGWFSSAPKTSG